MHLSIKAGMPNTFGLSPSLLAVVGVALGETTTEPPVHNVFVCPKGRICTHINKQVLDLAGFSEVEDVIDDVASRLSLTMTERAHAHRVFFSSFYGATNEAPI
jgi:hypothetical protein